MTKRKDLSYSTLKPEKVFAQSVIGITVADWNPSITDALLEGAISHLTRMGVKTKNIVLRKVPGTFELPLASQYLASQKEIDAVISLGCVIQGETRHFDFICQAAAMGIMEVGLKYSKPVVFGVLTTDTMKQAKERAGGKHGNKGVEAAETALKMLLLNGK